MVRGEHVKVSRSGDSVEIRIPDGIVRWLGLKAGDEFEMRPESPTPLVLKLNR